MANSLDSLRKSMVYATEIPSRSPKFKAHAKLGQAKQAVSVRLSWGRGTDCEVKVYQFVNGDWELLWTIPQGTKKEDLPWVDKKALQAAKFLKQNKRRIAYIQSSLVQGHVVDKLEELWQADPRKNLDDQLDWDWRQYVPAQYH